MYTDLDAEKVLKMSVLGERERNTWNYINIKLVSIDYGEIIQWNIYKEKYSYYINFKGYVMQ